MYNNRDMCENPFSTWVAAILIRGHPYISLPIGNDNVLRDFPHCILWVVFRFAVISNKGWQAWYKVVLTLLYIVSQRPFSRTKKNSYVCDIITSIMKHQGADASVKMHRACSNSSKHACIDSHCQTVCNLKLMLIVKLSGRTLCNAWSVAFTHTHNSTNANSNHHVVIVNHMLQLSSSTNRDYKLPWSLL